MARSLIFELNGAQIVCSPSKLDRTKLYGYIDIEALDSKGRKCQMATLAEDGRTLIGSGGSAFAYLSADGEWMEKQKLKPVDPEGKDIIPVQSTYSAPVQLAKTATIDEYLSHNIKGIYILQFEGDSSLLATELKKGTIFTFPYSFRGGLEADTGFLLAGADGTLFFAVGQPTNIRFVGLEQAAPPSEDEPEADSEDDSMDFGMM